MTNHTPHTPSAPQVLKCSGTADFLAALPQLTGFTATNSIFVLFFEGSRTREAMRIDLPPNDNPSEATDLLEFLSYTIRSFGATNDAPSAPAIAIMSERSFADCDGPPWARLARRIERRLSRDRVRPRELCVLAPDGWVSYLDPSAPRTGRSLAEIARSPISAAHKLTNQPIPTLAELGALPERDPDRTTRTSHEIASLMAAGRDPVSLAPEAARDLRAPRTTLAPEAAGRLAHVVADSMGWWHVAMGLLTRPEFPGELARELGPRRPLWLPVDIPPSGVDPAPAPCSMYSLLAAVCPEFTERERLATVRRGLARALADVPQPDRPSLYALSALVWWVCGSQTTAFQHVDEALVIAPEHEVARMVRRLIAVPLAARQMVLQQPTAVPRKP